MLGFEETAIKKQRRQEKKMVMISPQCDGDGDGSDNGDMMVMAEMMVNGDEEGGEKNCCDQYYVSMTPICSVIRFRIRK